ncbi:ABC transporter permease [Chryseolinea soli]|uniref:ABC transporter permease n=1 Tax=Chryseolinea soli TaxID=2321403 RepID=A0A385ST70_9BACT|nr:ABC transporter permease [Chryseolinea soli]AYB35033.1 ABC transporter permease [Chryseolinea soli]
MIRFYITLAYRNLRKHMGYSFITIFGFALGIAGCLMIWKYVAFELSYDRFHKHADNIYRTTFTEYGKNQKDDWFATFGYGLGPALLNEIPEVENYVRIHPLYGSAALINFKTPSGESALFQEKSAYFVDSSFLDVFTYDVLLGDASHALDNPSSMVITESLAARYFGKQTNPVGQTVHVRMKDWGDGDFVVTAVIKDVPQNSQLQFNMLLSMHNLLQIEYYRDPSAAWTATDFVTYVKLTDNTDVKSLEAKTKRFMDKHTGTEPLGVTLSYQPLVDVNFSPDLNQAHGHLNTLYFFLLISLFILFIAWINYVNLSTARATERAKEVGIKKAMGVLKSQLVTQFMFESLLINFISVALALGLAVLLLPVLSTIVGKDISFDFTRPSLWVMLFGLFFFGSFISGVYPAFMLSSFRITDVLKGKTTKPGRSLSLRQALVVFQFTASLLLIAGTFIIYRQMNFMLTRDKGLNMDQMLIVNGPQICCDEASDQRMLSFKNELLKIAAIKSVTSSGAVPGGGFSFTTGMVVVGKEHEKEVREAIHVIWVDTDFIQTYGMQVIAGRPWNPDAVSDLSAVFINEAVLDRFGLGTAEQALHEKLVLGDGPPFSIQGVIKNFHWNSLKTGYVPILFRPQQANYNLFSIQLHANPHEAIAQVQSIYQDYFPGNPFEYYFLDDFFNQQYKDEKQFESIFILFSILAVSIACLGLWGLASFTMAQRSKEISIRKVLGATVASILSLLSGQFVKLLFIASLIALPIVWYGATEWIDHFAFKIGLTFDLFFVPFLVLSIVALGTVSFQIVRGANTNPANVLRSE